jgi:hypothetical protein
MNPLKGNTETGRIHHHNFIVNECGKGYPDESRYEEEGRYKRDPEELNNSTQQ